MTIQLQEVLKTDTLEIQRQKFNQVALDIYNTLGGGTDLNVGTIGIDDGTLSAPGLYFGNEPTLGFYRPTQYKMGLVAENTLVASIGDHQYNPLVGIVNPTLNYYRDLNGYAANAISSGSYTSGSGYVKGTYPNVPLSGGSGTGALATVTVFGIVGSITDFGSEYIPGNYNGVPFTNISNTTEVISGNITGQGVGYVAGTYTNVSLTGGSGTGAIATIVIDALLQSVSSVTITNSGSGYEVGDVLSASNTNLGGSGSGFGYTLNSVLIPPFGGTANIVVNHITGSIPAFPSGSGSGYIPGVYENVPLTGGTGNGARATITVTGGQTVTGNITGGTQYQDGTYSNVKLYNVPTITYNVTVYSDLFEGLLIYRLNGLDNPSLTFDVGNTYRFDLSSSTTVGHPFNFANSTGGSLPDGITIVSHGTQGQPGAFVDVIINPSTSLSDQIDYYCTIHAGMGNTISFQSGTVGNYGVGATANINVFTSAVSSVSVNTPIIGYKSGDTLTALGVDLGNASGNGFSYEITAVTNTGLVSNVVITDSGNCKYLQGDSLSALDSNLGDGGGSGFVWDVSSGTRISSVVPVNDGFGYEIGDIVSIDTENLGGGTGSGFRYTISNFGSITSIVLSNPGSGYTQGNTLTISNSDLGGSGSGFLYTIGSVETTRTSTFTPNGNGYMSGSLGVGIDIVNDVPLSTTFRCGGTSRFVGDSYFESKLSASNGSSKLPSISFENKPEVGIFTSTEEPGDPLLNDMIFVGGGGRCFSVEEESSTFYKSINFEKSEISDFSYSRGSNYIQGVYPNQLLIGGSGSGAKVNLTSGFIASITASGAGYGSNFVHENVSITGGSGSGATANITTDENESIILFEVTDPGDGNYQVGDIIGIDSATLNQSIGASPTAAASFTISKINVISYVEIVDPGSSYEIGDVLEIPDGVFSNGYGFSFSVAETSSNVLGKFEFNDNQSLNSVKGRLTVKSLHVNDNNLGLIIGSDYDIKITNDSISKQTSGNLKIGSSSSLLEITGTAALKVPSGSQSQRPSNPPAGCIRFNTTSLAYEAYDGTNWGSLGGTRDVDGNTYILPESSPGANENILFFYNDGVNSLDVEQTKIKLYTATSIESLISGTNVVQWESGGSATAATLPNINYVYWNENLYSIDTTGTLGTSAPIHTSGTVTNGTVDLTYVSSIYGTFNLSASSVNVDVDTTLSINGGLIFSSDFDTNTSTIGRFTNDLKIGDGDLTQTPEGTLLKFTNSGQIQVNRNYGSSETYTTVLDSSLRTFELTDLHTVSGKTTLIKGTINAASSTLYNPTTSSGSKVTVFADNTTTGQKEVIELSVIDNGTDIYNIEIGDLYTSSKLIDVVLDYDGSNNVRITYTLDAAVATGNSVVVTVVSQRIKK